MPQIASYEVVKANRNERALPGGHFRWRTDFLAPPKEVQDEPIAFIAESTPHRVLRAHFHICDQFQVIVKGGGVLGKHPLAIHAVHFSRAFTPYGPIVNNEEGLGFLTLRARRDPGAQYLPESKEKLKANHDRNPWQVTELPKFDGEDEVSVHSFSQIKDEQGLSAHSLKLKPNARTSAPDHSNTDGQYLIVTKGSLVYEGTGHKAITVIFVKPHEQSFELVAGPEGVEALALNFPRRSDTAQAQATQIPKALDNATGFRVWHCQLCSFVYDEAEGMPHDGVPPGTRWEDVPETWTCPDCSTSKADFEMVVFE
jgi:rubredoxin